MSQDYMNAVPPLPWRERCRIIAWSVGLTAAVGAVSGLAMSILVLPQPTAEVELVEAMARTAALGVVAGGGIGVLLSPLGLIVGAIAVFSVRRDGTVEAQRRGIATVVGLLIGLSMTALLVDEFPDHPTLLQTLVFAVIGLTATIGSTGLVWVAVPRILRRYASSPNGN